MASRALGNASNLANGKQTSFQQPRWFGPAGLYLLHRNICRDRLVETGTDNGEKFVN
jgi:hypothetical protein